MPAITRLFDASPAETLDPSGQVFFALGLVRLLIDANAPSRRLSPRFDDVSASIASPRQDGAGIATRPQVAFRHHDDRLGPAGTDEWQAFVHDSGGNLARLVSQIFEVPVPAQPLSPGSSGGCLTGWNGICPDGRASERAPDVDGIRGWGSVVPVCMEERRKPRLRRAPRSIQEPCVE